MLTEIIPGYRYLRADGVEVEAFKDTGSDNCRIAVRLPNGKSGDGFYRWSVSGYRWPRAEGSKSNIDEISVAGRTMMSNYLDARHAGLHLVKCLTIPNNTTQQLELFE